MLLKAKIQVHANIDLQVLGHRYLSLDQSIARFESFRQMRHMSAFVFCSELIAAALRLESQCLAQSLQWYRARCFLLARVTIVKFDILTLI